MQKIILLSLLLLPTFTYSQVWFEIGPKATYGLTGFYNSNIVGDDNHDYQLSGAFSYGGALGINFDESHGINLEGLLTANRQTLTFRDPIVGPTDAIWEWDVVDAYLLYRYYTNGGAYFEIGPRASFVSSVTQTYGPLEVPTDNAYADLYLSGVAGVGAFLAGSEVFTLKMGLRLEFAATDMVDNQTDTPDYPSVYTRYDSEAGTYPFRATIGLELSFGIGGIAQSTCGRRKFVIGSRYD
jgi:hypothetical protein